MELKIKEKHKITEKLGLSEQHLLLNENFKSQNNSEK